MGENQQRILFISMRDRITSQNKSVSSFHNLLVYLPKQSRALSVAPPAIVCVSHSWRFPRDRHLCPPPGDMLLWSAFRKIPDPSGPFRNIPQFPENSPRRPGRYTKTRRYSRRSCFQDGIGRTPHSFSWSLIFDNLFTFI